MKDYGYVETMTTEVMDKIHDIVNLALIHAYNNGYDAGFESKNYVESGHCTGCVYETLPHYKEPCSECKNSHQNMYKAKKGEG